MHKQTIKLIFWLIPFLLGIATCRERDRCETIGERYSRAKADFEKIQSERQEGKKNTHERRLKKLLEKIQQVESDMEGCDMGKGLGDKITALFDEHKVAGLRKEIEQAIRSRNGIVLPEDKPGEWDFWSAIRTIESNLNALLSNIQLDRAGNATIQGYAFYIESIEIQAIDSGVLIRCTRKNLCISDSSATVSIGLDYMKAQRVVQYLNDYRDVVACKHGGEGCEAIMAKY